MISKQTIEIEAWLLTKNNLDRCSMYYRYEVELNVSASALFWHYLPVYTGMSLEQLLETQLEDSRKAATLI